MSPLFTPFSIGQLHLANRIVIAPMCQYSASHGNATDWHAVHLGQLAMSGAGLLILEATAVNPQGRVTPGDLGLYSDDNEYALERVLQSVKSHSPIKVAVQLGHAGRKASSYAPWLGGKQIPVGEDGAWQAVAPSALPHLPGEDVPLALSRAGMAQVRDAFAQAARRAARIGLDGIEIHAAHGYLLHEFLSPLSNHRTDAYGGSLENRMRFPLEVFDAAREAFAADRPMWVRVSASDWVQGGWDLDSTVAFAQALQRRGCDAVHVSSGGLSPRQQITAAPNYQVPFARHIKAQTGITTIAVGLITEPRQAEAIIAGCNADAVGLARAMLYNPRWPWHAAAALGAQVEAPRQYWRSQPAQFRNLFAGSRQGQR